jgi:hypothetical protein
MLTHGRARSTLVGENTARHLLAISLRYSVIVFSLSIDHAATKAFNVETTNTITIAISKLLTLESLATRILMEEENIPILPRTRKNTDHPGRFGLGCPSLGPASS